MKRSTPVQGLLWTVSASLFLTTIPAIAQGPPPKAQMTVINAESHAVTGPVRDMPVALPAAALKEIPVLKPGRPGGGGGGGGGTGFTDADLQPSGSYAAWNTSPLLPVQFEGIGANGYIPPDTNLAVGVTNGVTQVVETVNVEFAVYDKTGTLKKGPVAIDSLFTGVNSLCSSNNGGDPIVLYDQIAGRWLIAQLAYSGSSNYVCVAVSTGTDATGTFNAYSFPFGSTLPDYPKFGIWPGAYYFSANMFKGSSFLGAQACAFDSAAMIAGSTASMVCYQGGTSLYNILPASVDGTTSPKDPNTGLFLQFVAPGTLNLYQLGSVDFSAGTGSFTKVSAISVSPFQEACGGSACVPQPNTSEKLDSLADRLMYRLSYRNFGTYESLLVNHSVQISSASSQTGIRWYELQKPTGGGWGVHQQSTFSPDTSTYRWMGSIAQDGSGNMLLGYSTSSSSKYPGIAVTGRCFADSPNQMRSETPVFTGAGSQSNYNRWGDYSSMAIDPTDDTTFWYANEYLPVSGSFNWHTRIASFTITCK